MRWNTQFVQKATWSCEISEREQKEKVAKQVAEYVKDGDVIGVGSGSTSFLAIQAIKRKIDEKGYRILVIPTSHEIRLTCASLGIPTASLLSQRPDWAFDGADEVDPSNNLIKGRGGVLFNEKLMIKSSPRNFILIDPSKRVSKLCQKCPIPIEVYPLALHYVEETLRTFDCFRDSKIRLAKSKDGPVITESGNLLLDVWFDEIPDDLEAHLKKITGVIESGLFWRYNLTVLEVQKE